VRYPGGEDVMTLDLLKDEYSVFKFNPDFPVKDTGFGGEFVSVTKTRDEISVVAVSSASNDYEEVETGWRILKINGVLDFGLIGILSGISALLAEERISIFVVSTYNTDYIMVKKESAEAAIRKLKAHDYEILR
jgi:hypothetical protein